MYLPERVLIANAMESLQVEAEAVTDALEKLIFERELVREPSVDDGSDAIFTRKAFRVEVELATQIDALLSRRPRLPSMDEHAWARVSSEFSFPLSDEQKRAVAAMCGVPVGILTGGPGTGKTTIVKALVTHAHHSGASIALAAPTGRAAQRLGEATGKEATTIHRLLEFDPHEGGFKRDEVDPLEYELIIIDEASMLDAGLARALFKAIAPGSNLVLVGDRDQLPPVGPGRVLADLIDSDCVSVASLQRVFRQGARSEIVSAAHAVKAGVVPESSTSSDGEYFMIRRQKPEELVATIETVVAERFPEAFGYDPVDDVQVLVPVHRGAVGTQELNRVLQESLGGHGAYVAFGDTRFHLGDKVMQTRNNYRLETFNGDIGRVHSLDRTKRTLSVNYDGRIVDYQREDLVDLTLAYAITVHKSQGSEFPAVVMAISTHHYKLLYRKLVYTAMTRARERLVVVGKLSALKMAIDNISAVKRYSGLAHRIRQRVRK